jgi:hypothetical protein
MKKFLMMLLLCIKEEIEKRLPGKKVPQGLLDLVKKVFVGEDGKNST